MPASVTVTAPAKINLFLSITGVTRDGYHTLDTVMQSVSLCDTVTISKHDGSGIIVECLYPGIPQNEGNIACRAAKAFFEHTGITATNIRIHIDKNIPAQAGLAGGSADAAAVIAGLNALYGTELSLEAMLALGAATGADVPFCISGGCMRARGKGEIFTPLAALPECIALIAKPKSGVATKEAFARYDAIRKNIPAMDSAAMLSAIERGSLHDIGKAMYNVFEQVCGTNEPVRDILANSGASGYAMTGTGSAIIALFADEAAALVCKASLEENRISAFITRPVPHGVKIIQID